MRQKRNKRHPGEKLGQWHGRSMQRRLSLAAAKEERDKEAIEHHKRIQLEQGVLSGAAVRLYEMRQDYNRVITNYAWLTVALFAMIMYSIVLTVICFEL